MASHSNSAPAEGNVDTGATERRCHHGTIYSTRAVRDITYKIIPFCSLCLVIFSIGAILASTLAFDKPIPRHGTIVISSLLLSFFVLFSIGSMYLYFRNFRPRGNNLRDLTGVPRQTNHSNHHLCDHCRNTTRMFERPSAPVAFNTGMTSHGRPRDSGGGVIPSNILPDPTPNLNPYRNKTKWFPDATELRRTTVELEGSIPQQDHYSGQQHERQADKASRPGTSYQLPEVREHNRSIPTSMTPGLYQSHTSYRHDPHNILKNTFEQSLPRDMERYPSFTASPPNHPSQDMRGYSISSQVPSINLQTFEPSPLSSPGPVRTGPRQGEPPVIIQTPTKPPAESGKQRGREHPANASPLHPDIHGKRPIGPRPMNGGLYTLNNAAPDSRHSITNATVPNQTYSHSPSTSERARPPQIPRGVNDAQHRRASVPINIASTLNGMSPRQDTSNRRRSPTLSPRTFPASPMSMPMRIPMPNPNQTKPRHVAWAPLPHQLPTRDREHMSHTEAAYHNGRRRKSQPHLIPHEPPISEVIEEEEKEEAGEVPKIPGQGPRRVQIQRPRGGGQRRPQGRRRGSSRKFKRMTPSANRGSGVGFKGGNVMPDSAKNNDVN
ncbi:hypothetical protein F4859DRAFT_508890 [Xylaria cf. heliscus]|nr:hypothetical protein F4859DRAFT_508890 [Xylaria cf. heliscus]